jgi:hypothetical protein
MRKRRSKEAAAVAIVEAVRALLVKLGLSVPLN